MKEYITLAEHEQRYRECLRHKAGKDSAIRFSFNKCESLVRQNYELNHGLYEISDSTVFVVTKPKLREVFAADFRDRVVHHILIGRYGELIDKHFIPDTYNCRKGKGVLYGVNRVHEMLSRAKPTDYILKCDISSFFMSIDKDILWSKLETFLRKYYLDFQHEQAEVMKRLSAEEDVMPWQMYKQTNEDLEWVLSLTKKVVYHRPETKCVKHGDIGLFDKLEKSKSLFYSDPKKGLAIGNLTSQIFANFYMSDFDRFMRKMFGAQYGRYVDDFVCVGEKNFILSMIPKIKAYLREELGLLLHPHKTYFQPVYHGLTFTGSIIRKERVMSGKNTMPNIVNRIVLFRNVARHLDSDAKEKMLKRVRDSLCSYMGFLKHNKSYHFKQRIWKYILQDWRVFFYTNSTLDKVILYDIYNYNKKEWIVNNYYKNKALCKQQESQ